MLPSKTGPTPQIPAVLVFGGHDPSGGAGIAADISTLLALGCHPVVVITAITVQNTTQLQRYQLLEPGLVAAQAEALLEDIPIAACKTGMLGSAAIVAAVAEAVTALSAVPLVVDPVLRADAGGLLGEPDLVAALQTALLPCAALATPNIDECRALTSTAEPDQAASELMARGCKNILVTGTHAPTPKVVHRLYLATAVAAHLAHGEAMADAVNHALEYTYQSLRSAYRSGSGQNIPQRLWRMHRVDP
jgi:hydroxymethylpyrimidine/phosphomethylpyrimidine kinase